MKKRVQFQTIATLLIVAILLLGVTSPVISAPKETIRVWIQYSPGQRIATQALLNRSGAHFHYDFDQLDAFVVTLPKQALNGIVNNPNVVGVEEDAKRYPVIDQKTSDQYSILMSLEADTTDPNGQTIPWGIDAVQARDVWDSDRDGVVDLEAPTGAGRTLCIIDTGYYIGHEDLPGGVDGYSQVDDDWSRDGDGHGTHVAGTVAALNNDTGVVGVTPGGVSLYIVKIFNDDGDWTNASDLVDAAYQCSDVGGADVISMSLSGTRKNNPERRAFNDLYQQGVLSIAAASNDGLTDYHYPASYDSVVSVAAIDENLDIADFSQQNDQVELSGPGVSVLSTVPFNDDSSLTVGDTTYLSNHIEYSARGTASGALVDGGLCTSTGNWSGAVVLCERGDIDFYTKVMNVQNSGGAAAVVYNNEPGNFFGTLGDGYSSTIVGISLSQEDGQYLVANRLGANGEVSSIYSWPSSSYEAWDGTSMATPHVAAVAALVWSANPTWTNSQIREALQVTATDLGAVGRDVAFGFGLVQAKAALDYLGGGSGDNPPTVTITAPNDGASFDEGSSIDFAGTAIDDEDGDISGALVWTSDLDGSIGSGAAFTAELSIGTHTITAEVTDSGENTSSDSITVTVSSTTPGEIILNVSPRSAGPNWFAELSWSGATSVDVDIYRDGDPIDTTVNDGSFSDKLGKVTVPFTYTYQVCEAGTAVCSEPKTLTVE